MVQRKINIKDLKDFLEYCPETGNLFWKNKKTKPAGCLHKKVGYKVITISGKQYYQHRVIWAMNHGSWPKNTIDHINGNRLDNRISNLRDVPHFFNMLNQNNAAKTNKCGVIGVRKQRNKWRASIRINGRVTHLGIFEDLEDAKQAYLTAKEKRLSDVCHMTN